MRKIVLSVLTIQSIYIDYAKYPVVNAKKKNFFSVEYSIFNFHQFKRQKKITIIICSFQKREQKKTKKKISMMMFCIFVFFFTHEFLLQNCFDDLICYDDHDHHHHYCLDYFFPIYGLCQFCGQKKEKQVWVR